MAPNPMNPTSTGLTLPAAVPTVTFVPNDELLFVTQVAPYLDGPAGVHGVLDQAAIALAQIAEVNGLHARRVDDVRDLDSGALASASVLALFTIGETPWSPAQRGAIVERVRSGSLRVLAIHSATDACHGWDEYGLLVGARFNGHPWTQTVNIEVLDSTHPATAHLGSSWRWYDEIYQFRDLRPDAHVLLRVPVQALHLEVPGATQPDFGFPLSWCFTEGDGRVFSTSLGHFPGAWETPAYVRHLAGGLRWALDA
jgi:type 1 glutamine amidotransferase